MSTKLDIAALREEIERHDLRWFDKTYTIVGKDEARVLLDAAEERDRLHARIERLESALGGILTIREHQRKNDDTGVEVALAFACFCPGLTEKDGPCAWCVAERVRGEP